MAFAEPELLDLEDAESPVGSEILLLFLSSREDLGVRCAEAVDSSDCLFDLVRLFSIKVTLSTVFPQNGHVALTADDFSCTTQSKIFVGKKIQIFI